MTHGNITFVVILCSVRYVFSLLLLGEGIIPLSDAIGLLELLGFWVSAERRITMVNPLKISRRKTR